MADIIIETGNAQDIIVSKKKGSDVTVVPADNKAVWGNITGNIQNQTDLIELIQEVEVNAITDNQIEDLFEES